MSGVVSVESIVGESAELEAAIERCRREIAEIERLLLAGHRDVQGLVMALSDWSAEPRLIERIAARVSNTCRRIYRAGFNFPGWAVPLG
jgi:hypothetical protein